ncbi:MAG: polyprenyl synthetase family protein [Clostridium sp.]
MRINELKIEVDNYLEDYFKGKSGYNKLIYDASAYSINIGGKRIRPILLLLIYEMYKENYKDVIDMAAAVEMIHTYSLIHDDLPSMDNDDLRRGKPTNHKVFGENIAILAGDTLLNEAMNVMFNFSLRSGIEALEASKIISEAAGAEGMIGGQVVDIISEGKKISLEELEYMHEKKTGALIVASVLAGGILGGANDEELKLLKEYGKKLGLAFQIKDDILDVVGSVEKLGKNTKMDEDRNKTNFISVYGLEQCERMCNKITEECIEILDTLNGNSTELEKLTRALLEREN